MDSSLDQQQINQIKLKLVRDLNDTILSHRTNYVRMFSGWTLMILSVAGIVLILFYAIENSHNTNFLAWGYSLLIISVCVFFIASIINIVYVNQVIKYKFLTTYDMWFVDFINQTRKFVITKKHQNEFEIKIDETYITLKFSLKRKWFNLNTLSIDNREKKFLKHNYFYNLKYLFYKTSTYYQSCLKDAVDLFTNYLINDGSYLDSLIKK